MKASSAAPLPPSATAAKRRTGLLMGIVLLALFCVYGTFRQRYVGATDWFGYYQLGHLLARGEVALPVPLPAETFPSQVPLGFHVSGGQALPQYPPGFAVLLALASWGGLEFWVTPAIGLLSCWLMFLAVRLDHDRLTAGLIAGLWGLFPPVVFGATTLMSDLVATTVLLAAYLCYRRREWAASALLAGFAICVRPTNALFLIVFAPVWWRDRTWLRYGLWLTLPATVYGFYNTAIYGAPWRTGYSDISYDLTTTVFTGHLHFYLEQTLQQVGFIFLGLVVVGALYRPRRALFLLAWFGAYLLFYCFWRSGGDRWWWTRFLLPGYPPLFLLGATGFAVLRARLGSTRTTAQRAANAALVAAVVLQALLHVDFGRHKNDLWVRHKGREYHDAVRAVEAYAPPGSYVGSVEFGGSFRVYSDRRPFVSVYPDSSALTRRMLTEGRRVFLVVEPWNAQQEQVRRLMDEFGGRKIADLGIWSGVPVFELSIPLDPSAPERAGEPPAPAPTS